LVPNFNPPDDAVRGKTGSKFYLTLVL